MSMEKIILAVEDETPIRNLIIDVLNEEDDYKGIGAKNGLEAIELLKTITVDLITLDMNMPGMNGNEFLTELSKVAPSIPVIGITANPKSFKSHPQVKAVIDKPFDILQLITAVEKNINS